MKGDFSRLTFDRKKQFSRVFMQQGRVQLDADWNEQAAIFVDSIRTLSADVIGPHAGTPDSFKITPDSTHGFLIGEGRYYVHGIGCVNDRAQGYDEQKHYPHPETLTAGTYLVYLDVWERHVTAAEDDSIREVALGGAETTSRGQIVWQVKTLSLEDMEAYHVRARKKELACLERAELVWPRDPQRVEKTRRTFCEYAERLLARQIQKKSTVKLRAAVSAQASDAKGQYRGVENQLYRVEIHKGTDEKQGSATFKWSRENGSVVFPIEKIEGLKVTLRYFGKDSRGGLNIDDWVEIVDERDVLGGKHGTLHQIKDVDLRGMDTIVTLNGEAQPLAGRESRYHLVLRRWDQVSPKGKPKDEDLKDGLAVRDGTWIKLEDGIEIQFCHSNVKQRIEYRSGDYWLIPARTATSAIEWPEIDKNGNPTTEKEPFGIDHHYAPLAFITVEEDRHVTVEHDCRYVIHPLGIPVGPPPKSPFGLNVPALTFAGALLGIFWFGGEYLPKYLPIETDGFSRLFVYICIGAGLGVGISGLYNLFLWWFAPLWQSQKTSETPTEVAS